MRSRLPYLLLAAVAAGGGALSGAGWWLAASVAAAEREEQAAAATGLVLRAARLARDALPRALDPADRMLAQLQARQTAVARGDRREAEALEQTLLTLARRGQDGVRLVAVTDAAGSVAWSSQPGTLPAWLGNQDFFMAHRYGRVATAVGRMPNATPGQGALVVSRPLLGREGGFAGIALVALEPGRIAQLLPVANAPEEPVLALYHADGGLLARGRGAGAIAMPAQLDPRLLPETGGERNEIHRDPRDNHALATATAQLPGQDLVVAATLDDTAGAAAARRLALVAYGLAALLNLAWLGLLGWLGWRLRRNAAEGAPEEAHPLPAVPPAALPARAGVTWPSLIESMPTASYAALVAEDGSVRITALSQALERLTGHPPALFQDQDRWHRCIDWSSYPPGQPLPERLLQEAEAEVDYRLRRADGRWMWLREACRVVARNGTGVEVVGVLHDVTREHDLAHQAERATRAAAQGLVAAGLAHDLKGPLQTISFAAQNGLDALASGTAGTEEVRQRLLRVVMQSERASAIARQLGDFTKLESLKLEPVHLASAVRAAMGEVSQSLQEAGVEVQLRLADNLPPVRGLGLMVEQVLVNLCLNARDAMASQPEGQRVLRLGAIFRADTDQVEVTVTDSGGGVPPALLDRVFEMHFTTKERSKGSGLGLTLCRFIMSRFSGGIALRNVPGGAEVRLVFRRAQSLAPPPLPRQGPAAPVPGDAPARASAAG